MSGSQKLTAVQKSQTDNVKVKISKHIFLANEAIDLNVSGEYPRLVYTTQVNSTFRAC